MHLPNTWLMVRYSTKNYEFAPRGPNEVRPDVRLPTTWAEYRSGRDAVLEYVVGPRKK